MAEDSSQTASSQRWRFRYSLSSLLLVVTLVCLAIALALTYRRLMRAQRELQALQIELQALQPLAPREVARQFEEATTLGPITTTVKDVRYSPSEDAYRVEFSWVNATTGGRWASDTKLTADGFGRYVGRIRNGPFIGPLGVKEGFTLVVETPSPLKTE